jgi:glycosyltransferase involved in cell wall biosynthesis
MDKKLISIVVPVFNEELNIHNFYGRMTKACEDRDYSIELILVNDGSRDNSWEVIQALASKDTRVKGINLSRNFGSYQAIEAGFGFAKGDGIMCISADLQDPPEIINAFYDQWTKGNDIVWGTREGRDDPFFKALYAKVFYWFVRKIAFPDFPEDGMDIGLFDRRIVNEYLKIKDRNSIPFFAIYSMGFKQKSVPYRREARVAGESGWPFWKRVKCAIDIAVNFSYIPIRMISLCGVIASIIGFVYGTILVISKITSPEMNVSGWTSLIVVCLFLGGIQLISLGIISEYVWRTSDKIKGHPVYLVMNEVNVEKN